MRFEILRPIGMRVEDVTVGPLRREDVGVLRKMLADNGVAVFHHQDADDEQFLAFLRSFGELVFTEGERPVDGYPDLNVVTNVGRATPPKSTFHVDTTYVQNPPAYTALRAVEVPVHGGQTLFTNQYRAYEALPQRLRDDIADRVVTHVVTGLDGVEGSADHPLVSMHPISGRRALYLSAPARCASVSGLTDSDGAELIRHLVEHSTDESNVHRHEWSAGDVVVWDNRCVMHKADHSGVVGDRTMHRGMVAST